MLVNCISISINVASAGSVNCNFSLQVTIIEVLFLNATPFILTMVNQMTLFFLFLDCYFQISEFDVSKKEAHGLQFYRKGVEIKIYLLFCKEDALNYFLSLDFDHVFSPK